MIEPEVTEEDDARPQVDQAREEAEAETRLVLQRAKEEAEATLLEAEARLQERERQFLAKLDEERAQLLEAARQEGYALGLAQGKEAGEQTVVDLHAAALEKLHLSIEEASAERVQWYENQQKDLIKLALLIAQKILLLELVTSRESVVKMAEAALKHVTDKTHVRLRCHPSDMPRLSAARGQLTLAVDNLSTLELVGDPNVGVGGCMIDTRTGMVDARLATQLAEVAASLLNIAPGPDGAPDMDPVILAAVRALGQGGHVLAAAPQQNPGWSMPPGPAGTAGHGPQAVAQPSPAQMAPQQPAVPAPVVEVAVPASVEEVAQPAYYEEVVAPVAPPMMQISIPVPEPEPVYEPSVEPTYHAPEPAPAPQPAPASVQQPEQPRVQRMVDPSRRAADALAARLGQLKRGRGVITLSEEYDLSLLKGTLSDKDLEAIVKQTGRNIPQTGIGIDEVLVHNPYALEEAADALAERLGKKKTRRPGAPREGGEEPTEQMLDQLGAALGDQKIDEILGTLLPRVAESKPEEAAPEPASLDKASENLAKLLGKTKRKTNRPWYEQ
jgi:flagellar assembly protein FliH